MFSQKEVVELLKDLISIHSPYFKEDNIIEYVYNWFKEKKIPIEYHHYHDTKVTDFMGKNLIGSFGDKKDGPVLLLNGHLDTVNICNNWTSDPLKAVVSDNEIYGLGALDMKSGVTSIMMAVKKFYENHKSPKGKVIYNLVSDEEGPYGLGTNAIIEDGLINDADVAIIPEPSSGFTGRAFPCLCLGARGGFGYKIIFYGKSAHAANPEKGISAITDAAKVIVELEKTKKITDEDLGKGSTCIIEFSGTGDACSVVDKAYVRIFQHIVNGESKDTIRKEIADAVNRADIKSEYEIVFREAPSKDSDGFMPYTVSKDNEYTQSFIKSIENITGVEPEISYFSSIGDFNYIGSRLNIPTFVFGPDGERYHSNDEYVKINTVVDTTNVIYDYMVRILT